MNTLVAQINHTRCDRCNAASKVLAVLPSGATLAFCGHHAKQHEPKLRELGAIIADRKDG